MGCWISAPAFPGTHSWTSKLRRDSFFKQVINARQEVDDNVWHGSLSHVPRNDPVTCNIEYSFLAQRSLSRAAMSVLIYSSLFMLGEKPLLSREAFRILHSDLLTATQTPPSTSAWVTTKKWMWLVPSLSPPLSHFYDHCPAHSDWSAE